VYSLSDFHLVIYLPSIATGVSCGIPDFRSRDGVYATLKDGDYQLDDPQQMYVACEISLHLEFTGTLP
jgi:hypothetical protein